MDSGTDAISIQLNKDIPLGRGYSSLVNRNEDDTKKIRDIKIAHEKACRDLSNKTGSKYLRKRLSDELCQNFIDRLPTMQAQVRNLEAMNAFDQDIQGNWQQPKIVELIQKFTDEFRKQIEGQAVDVEGQTLSVGAKLNDCFYTQIHPLLNQAVEIDRKELFVLWRNMVGYNNMMFFPQQAFNNVVKKLLQQYKEPLEIATYLSANIIKEAVSNSMYKVDAYPYLAEAVLKLMTEQIRNNEESTIHQLLCHLKAQKSFINNYHPDFMKKDDLYSGNGPLQTPTDQTSFVSEPTTLRRTHVDDEMSVEVDEFFNKTDEVMRGSFIVHATISRVHHFLLTLNTLAWFKDDMDSRPKGSVAVEGLKLIKSKAGQKYNLQKNGKSRQDSVKMVVSFKNRDDEEAWLDAFRAVGVMLTFENGPSQPDTPEAIRKEQNEKVGEKQLAGKLKQTPVPVKVKNDPRKDFENDPVLGEVAIKLYSYMKIVDETVHDLTPKYISYFLIHKTLKYTRLKLLSDVLKEDMNDLMKLSEDEISKREEYFRIFNTTMDALKIMGEVSNAGQPKKKEFKIQNQTRRSGGGRL